MQTVYRAKVTKVTAAGPFVEVPQLGVGMEFGPCERLDGTVYTVGMSVLVAQVEGIVEDIVLLGKLI